MRHRKGSIWMFLALMALGACIWRLESDTGWVSRGWDIGSAAAYYRYYDTKEYLHRRPFDSAEWKRLKRVSDDRKSPERRRMVEDLLKRHRLIGMTKQQVITLLGPSSGGPGDGEFIYHLGKGRTNVCVDTPVLWIKYDSSGIVVQAKHTTTGALG